MENNTNQIIGSNIAKYRKNFGITQFELAEKLNYSDKAVSKWERGESLPDVQVLLEIANMFEITLNDLCYESATQEKVILPTNKKINHFYITLLSFGLCWLVATVVFAFLIVLAPELKMKWLAFIYAIPASGIVLLVLNSLWGKRIWNAVFVSIIIWGTLLSICLTSQNANINWLYIIGIPLELLTIVWYFFKTKILHRLNNFLKNRKNN